jgi:hypothetical protein
MVADLLLERLVAAGLCKRLIESRRTGHRKAGVVDAGYGGKRRLGQPLTSLEGPKSATITIEHIKTNPIQRM